MPGQLSVLGQWRGAALPATPPRPRSLALQQQDEEEVNISQESSEEEQ